MMSKTAFVLVIAALLFCTGCAAIQKSMTVDMERKLAAAGFQMKFATTAEQRERAASLPQHKLTPVRGPDGKTGFVWADATDCKCIYVGTAAAYDRYRSLELEENIVANEEMSPIDWRPWGTWGPWY
jgi:hypothetical protein